MKNTKECPKCKSNKIANFDELAKSSFPRLLPLYSEWFVCCDCGYCERWIDSEFNLKTIWEKHEKENKKLEKLFSKK